MNSRGVGYDYGSVMHYGEFFFTKQRGSRTLLPKTIGASIGQRIGLSDMDIQQARLLYQCDGMTALLESAFLVYLVTSRRVTKTTKRHIKSISAK